MRRRVSFSADQKARMRRVAALLPTDAAAAGDPVPILKLLFCLRCSFYSMIDAWCWMIWTLCEIPPLITHFLNLPRCGRNARVYLSLLGWSAWPSSQRTHRKLTLWRGRAIHSEHLCRTRGWIRTIALSSHCASCSDHLSAVLDRPAGLWGRQVRGGGGLRCFSAGPTSQPPHCSSSPPSSKLNTLTCAGS